MRLTNLLTDYINAAFTGLWIVTQEPDEAESEIIRHSSEHRWQVASWDIAQGLRLPGGSAATEGADPLAALRALPTLASADGTALLLLHNFHRFLNNPKVIQTTFSQLIAGKQQRTFMVVLAPVVQIPLELEKLFVVIEHPLPDREQLQQIALDLLGDSEKPQASENHDQILTAAAGLTRYEAEGAFALSLTRHNNLRPEVIWELKGQALKKNNLLTLHRGEECFDTLGGLTHLKDFCRRALRPGSSVSARGLLLLGVPGTGKSAFAKSLGNETSRPTLLLDLGGLMGGLVGQTEQNVRQALRIADAMAPCILFVDELEKALSGIGGTGDGGVATRLFGTLLTWLSDHRSDVFFVGTSNDITKLPPEFARAERFDGVFFLDLPTSAEKDRIWELYRKQFSIPTSQAQPKDTSWTGAEIRSCCRLAALLDVPLTQAAHNIVPVAVTAAEQVERLRTWASGRCLAASTPGVFSKEGNKSSKGRRIQSDPNNN